MFMKESRESRDRAFGLALVPALFAWLALAPALVLAQETPAQPTSAEATKKQERPGRYRLGPFYVTPKFHFGPIGFDSNVFYTPTKRQADVTINAGPGLDMVLPMGRGGRFYTGGALDYLYFVRTASQRRWNGSALAGLSVRGSRTEAMIEEGWTQTFSRPSYDVNERVLQTSEGTHAEIKRRVFGRTSLGARGGRRRSESASGNDYLGTDLGQALTLNEYRAGGDLAYAVTIKTSLVGLGEYEWHRYPRDPVRDVDMKLAGGGLRTDASALVSGHALAGMRWYRSSQSTNELRTTWIDVDATLNITSRTHIGGAYLQDFRDSFFIPADGVPVLRSKGTTLRLDKQFTQRVDLRLFARRTRYVTDAPITVVVPDQGPLVSVRNDLIREAGADLGYRFRPSFRFGVVATYTDRESPFAYFGIQGLVVGFNAQFNP